MRDQAVYHRHRPQRHGSIPQEDEFGNRVLVPARFRIDEDLLREMAQTGRGRYFHASDSEGLAQVYAEIDKLEKSEFEETKFSEYTELFPWFAGLGLAMILLIGVLTGNSVSFVAIGRRIRDGLATS